MPAAPRPPALPRWRTAGVVALCALAGAGLRRGLSDPHPGNATSELQASGIGAPGKSSSSPSRPLTPDSLSSLSRLDRLTSLATRLPDMTVAEIAPLVKSLIATCPEEAGFASYSYDPGESAEPALLQMLFTRWAELDAPGMLAALHEPGFRYSVNVRFRAVTAWAELRGTAALQAVAQEWPGLATAAAWEIIQRQPGRCAELLPWLRAVEEYSIPTDLMESLRTQMTPEDYVPLAIALGEENRMWNSLQDLAKSDAPRAMQIAKSLPRGKFRDSALEALFRDMNGDLHEQFTAAGVNFRAEYDALPPDSALRDDLASDYAERILKEKNPDAALQWARSLTNKKARGEALARIASSLPENTSAADRTRLRVEAWLAHPSFGDTFITRDFKAWHTENPGAADEWLQTVSPAPLRAALLRGVVTTPAEDLARFSSSSERLAYVTEALFPDEQRMKEQTDDSAPPSLLSRDNVPEDLAHLAQLTAASKWGVKEDVWAAANRADRRFLSAPALKYLFEQSGTDQTKLDKAITLFDSMAPEERSLGAWYEASRARVLKDTPAATEWVNTLPPGPERDAAAIALVENLSGTAWQRAEFVSFRGVDDYRYPGGERDPAAAFSWAASLSGETERIKYVSETARDWALLDAAAARAAVTASTLPDTAKQSLLQQLPEGGPR